MAIDSNRLRLRPVTPADIDDLHALDLDIEVMRYVSAGEPTGRDTIADWVIPRSQAQFRVHGTGLWTATLRDTAEFAGWVQLRLPRHSFDEELELSYRFHRHLWGRGLAVEAASTLIAVTFLSTDTQRVFASTHRDHRSSQRVMTKLGMRVAASSLSAERYSDHALKPDIEYELLREHWLRAAPGRHTATPPRRRSGRHRLADPTAEMPA